MKIRFSPSFPEEVKSLAQFLLEKWAPILCRNLDSLFVSLANDPENAQGRIYVQPKYRTASMNLSTSWLTMDPDLRENVIVHELSHGLTTPLMNLVSEIVQRYVPGDAREEIIDYFLEEVNESLVEDVARAVQIARQDRLFDPLLDVPDESVSSEDTECSCHENHQPGEIIPVNPGFESKQVCDHCAST